MPKTPSSPEQSSVRVSRAEGNRISFWCPGCDHAHTVGTGPDGWQWNGSEERPTITPSILVNMVQWEKGSIWHRLLHEVPPGAELVCHSFVTDGRIQFLGDCTHTLAGQTIDLPLWPKETRS